MTNRSMRTPGMVYEFNNDDVFRRYPELDG
jgi:hypothetical protein